MDATHAPPPADDPRVAYTEDEKEAVPSPRPRGVDMERALTIEETASPRHRPGHGVEMKREMTQEDKDLAAAGYDHLNKPKPGVADTHELENVDITEHKLPFAELEAVLQTNFEWKDPAASQGLTEEEAKARLARDGKNILTPPKKKSALRKVS